MGLRTFSQSRHTGHKCWPLSAQYYTAHINGSMHNTIFPAYSAHSADLQHVSQAGKRVGSESDCAQQPLHLAQRKRAKPDWAGQ